MLRYILKRLLWMIPIILTVAIVVFSLMSLAPGKPEEIILGSNATEEAYAVMRHNLKLDDPFLVRLARFLKNTFIDFDFGQSWIDRTSVFGAMMEKFPRTIIMALSTFVLSYLIGIPLGINAAIHQNRWQDSASMFVALMGISVPSFWLALLLVILFAVKLQWLPPMGFGGVKYYILPALAGAFSGIATSARQTRSSMLDVIRSDYITTARAKGVPNRQVITKHAFRNALIPIITLMGGDLANLLGGTMVIETIFAIPGIGSYIVSAVGRRDYPAVQGSALLLSIIFSIIMLVVDLIYAAADPRIKAQYASPSKRRKTDEA